MSSRKPRSALPCSGCATLNVALVDIDFAPFAELAALLYQGPWVAERYLTMERLLHTDPDAVNPVVRQIASGAARFSAADAFKAEYRRAELAREIDRILARGGRARRADHADDLHDRGRAERSAYAQFTARHVYELHEPRRSRRTRAAGRFPLRRFAGRYHADRSRRPRSRACGFRQALAARNRAAARSNRTSSRGRPRCRRNRRRAAARPCELPSSART